MIAAVELFESVLAPDLGIVTFWGATPAPWWNVTTPGSSSISDSWS